MISGGGGGGLEYSGEGWKMVNRVPFHLVWPSIHLLHRKMTKNKSKEDIKHPFSFILWKYLMQ